MRNGNCWAAPGRSFRKECPFSWEVLQCREQFSSCCEKKLGSLQGICFTNLQKVENKIPRGEVWEQKFRVSFLCVPHWGLTGQGPAQDICSLPSLFASELVLGWDLGLHWKLVILLQSQEILFSCVQNRRQKSRCLSPPAFSAQSSRELPSHSRERISILAPCFSRTFDLCSSTHQDTG